MENFSAFTCQKLAQSLANQSVSSIHEYYVDTNLIEFNFVRPFKSLCYENKDPINMINLLKEYAQSAAAASAIKSIHDYYIDPNLTEEDRAVLKYHDDLNFNFSLGNPPNHFALKSFPSV